MWKFIVRRLLLFALSLFAMSIVVFFLARLSGDPRSLLLSTYSTKEDWDHLGKVLGLDQPLYYQYWVFLTHALRGDLGTSIVEQRPVLSVIAERFPATLKLGLGALIISLGVGIPLGVISAVKRGSIWDSAAKVLSLAGLSLPTFWTAIMLIFLFGVKLQWLPIQGRDEGIKSLILPWITLGSFWLATNVRLLRTAMLDVLDSEFVKLARAKGAPELQVIWKHAFKNAVIVPLTYAGITLGTILAGSIVIEQVFAWPGMGRLALDSIQKFDYPVVQGVVLTFTLIYLSSSLLVDILYGLIDPRIRYE